MTTTPLAQFGLGLIDRLGAAIAAGEVRWRSRGPDLYLTEFEGLRLALATTPFGTTLTMLSAGRAADEVFTPDTLAENDAPERERIVVLLQLFAQAARTRPIASKSVPKKALGQSDDSDPHVEQPPSKAMPASLSRYPAASAPADSGRMGRLDLTVDPVRPPRWMRKLGLAPRRPERS